MSTLSCNTRPIHSIKSLLERAGNHFFDPAAMRFFGCRTAKQGYTLTDADGTIHYILCVTSEQGSHQARRTYSVRCWKADDDFGRLSAQDYPATEFQAHASSAAANRAMKALIVELSA